MASGDSIVTLDAQSAVVPATNGASHDTVSDASTPAIIFLVLDFDGTTQEHADWHWTVPSNYDGGGFTWSFKYAPDGANGGTTEFELRMLPLADLDVLTADLGIDTQTASTITDTAPATPTNKFNVTATGTLSHANAGSPSAGDRMVTRISRDPATDTNTDDAQLMEVRITET